MKKESSEPNVMHYSHYRIFLKAYYEYQKALSPHFSHRFFAKKAGLESPNYLKLVIDAKRNLTKKSLAKFQSGLGLNEREAEYFENLVFFNQAESTQEKNKYYDRLLKLRNPGGLKKIGDNHWNLFSNWFYSVLREMVALKNSKRTASWFASRLRPQVSNKAVDGALEMLLEADLIGKTANGFIQKDINITTSDEASSTIVKQYHREMINLAQEALDHIEPKDRDISAVTIPIRKRDFAKIKEHLQMMRKELFHLAAEPGEADDIIQVNFQLFPLTKSAK